MKLSRYSATTAAILAANFILVVSACYKPRVGCLDPNATNFDVSADKDTGNCVYAKLVLQLSHTYDGVGLRTDSFYTNQYNQKYKIKEFAYYLSGFTVLQGLQEYPLEDTLHAFKRVSPSANDSVRITLTSDIGLIRRNTVELVTGTFRESGVFDGIRMDFGLRSQVMEVLPGSVRAGSVLRPQPEMLYDSTNQRYHFGRFIIEHELQPGSATVTDTLLLGVDAFAAGGNKIEQLLSLKQTAGFDFDVKTQVDYKLWFDQVDWTSDMTTIKAKIAQNLISGFLFAQ